MLDSIYHMLFKLFCNYVFRVKKVEILLNIHDVVMGVTS